VSIVCSAWIFLGGGICTEVGICTYYETFQ
jgi:hypothetical protein